MSDPIIQVRCNKCDRTVEKDSIEEANELVESHNEARHGGDDVATVIGEVDPLDSFLDVIEDSHLTASIHRANRADNYRVLCKDCEGVEVREDESEAWHLAQKHNDFAHDGDAIAGIVEEDLTGKAADRMPSIGSTKITERLVNITDRSIVTEPRE